MVAYILWSIKSLHFSWSQAPACVWTECSSWGNPHQHPDWKDQSRDSNPGPSCCEQLKCPSLFYTILISHKVFSLLKNPDTCVESSARPCATTKGGASHTVKIPPHPLKSIPPHVPNFPGKGSGSEYFSTSLVHFRLIDWLCSANRNSATGNRCAGLRVSFPVKGRAPWPASSAISYIIYLNKFTYL